MRSLNFIKLKNYILQHKLLSLLAICVIGVALFVVLKHLSINKQIQKTVMKPIVHTQIHGGMEAKAAVIEAGKTRLKPIFMTAKEAARNCAAFLLFYNYKINLNIFLV